MITADSLKLLLDRLIPWAEALQRRGSGMCQGRTSPESRRGRRVHKRPRDGKASPFTFAEWCEKYPTFPDVRDKAVGRLADRSPPKTVLLPADRDRAGVAHPVHRPPGQTAHDPQQAGRVKEAHGPRDYQQRVVFAPAHAENRRQGRVPGQRPFVRGSHRQDGKGRAGNNPGRAREAVSRVRNLDAAAMGVRQRDLSVSRRSLEAH